MSDVIQLKASVRERVGKGAARAVRRQGLVPGVIYGDNKAPEPVSLDYVQIHKQLHTGNLLSTLYEIEVDGKSTQVLARDCQVDPIKDMPMHVDFLRIGKGTKVSIAVSVQFTNEENCPGLKRGGVLNVVRHELELTCSPNIIPEMIEIDLSEADIGTSIHISDIQLPEGVVSTITDRDFTIVTVTGAAAEEPEDDEAGDEEPESAEDADGEEEKEGE